MTDNNFYSAPAGWYPDPLGLPQLRWWDSTQWTHQVAEARQPMVMQETTFKWADDDEQDVEPELTSRRERRERENRGNVDTPAPTAKTLRELEPPSREDVVQDSVSNPNYRTEAPVSDADRAESRDSSATHQPGTSSQQQQRYDDSPVFDTMAEEAAQNQAAQGQATQGQSAQGQGAQGQGAQGQSAQSQQYTQQSSYAEQAQQYADRQAQQAQQQQAPQYGQQQGQSQQYAPQQGQPQQYAQQPGQYGQPQQGQPQQYAQQPGQYGQPGQAQPQQGYYNAPVYGQQVNEPQAAQYGYTQPFQAQPQAAPWVLHQGQSLPDRPDFRVIHTASVWMIALIPMLQLVVGLLLLTAFGMGANQPLMLAVWIVPYFITVLFAYLDHRALKADGRQHTAHWALAFAGAPVYLILRAISSLREAGKGFGPELAWIGLSLLLIGSIVAVPGLAIATVPSVFVAEAENSIESDAAAIGATLDVTCPATPPVLFEQGFTCEGVRSDGSVLEIEVSLQRVNGWVAWRVDSWGVFTLG